MHYVSAWASPAPFPTAAGLFRIHDATHRWNSLHTGPGQWDSAAIERLDAVLIFRDRYAPGVPVIYVIAGGGDRGGWLPDWLGPGDFAGPFREHMQFMAARYADRIWAVEVLNEPNAPNWFDGTVEMLVDLTRIVDEEWPGKVIAPSFTESGHAMMREFYAAGGGQYVDIVGWHHGVDDPEGDTVAIKEAVAIAGSLPLWTTEMNVAGGAAELMRTYIIHWLYGAKSVGFYSWEMSTYYGGDDGFAHTSHADGSLTEAGEAYIRLQSWLVGRTVTGLEIDGERWTVSLDDGHVIEWENDMPVRR